MHRAIGEAAEGWYHLMPMGEHPGVMTGKGGKREETIEVIDAEAVDAMMAAHRTLAGGQTDWPGYLVDIEHLSRRQDGSTAAYAWGVELEARTGTDIPENERGIWVKLHKTPLGEQAIGTVYKFLSAVNLMENIGGNRWRPVSIEDIGLTNRPAYKTLVPAEHRDRNNNEEDSDMLDKLKALLAKHSITVVDDTGEDGIVTALETAMHTMAADAAQLVVVVAQHTADKAKLATAEHRVQELEKAELDREADAFVAEHKDRFSDTAKLRELFIAHREAAREMVGIIKVPVAPVEEKATRVLHRAEGSTPEREASDTAAAQRDAEQRAYVSQVAVEHRCSHVQAWHIAAQRRPELFTEQSGE
jgi:hypothetical protein